MLQLKTKINEIKKKFDKEYSILGERSEIIFEEKLSLNNREKKLKDEYEKLDEKTGLNVLYEELHKLMEEENSEYEKILSENFKNIKGL